MATYSKSTGWKQTITAPVNFANTNDQTIFTVPAGKIFFVQNLLLQSNTGSPASGNFDRGFLRADGGFDVRSLTGAVAGNGNSSRDALDTNIDYFGGESTSLNQASTPATVAYAERIFREGEVLIFDSTSTASTTIAALIMEIVPQI